LGVANSFPVACASLPTRPVLPPPGAEQGKLIVGFLREKEQCVVDNRVRCTEKCRCSANIYELADASCALTKRTPAYAPLCDQLSARAVAMRACAAEQCDGCPGS
jgi:hypothetical protein